MWTKVCGIRDLQTAEFISDLPISAVGLNFFTKSVRSVTKEEAEPLALKLRGKTELVGLFVNHSIEFIDDCATSLHLDWIQLHGDESPDFLKELQQQLKQSASGEIKLIKAFRVDEAGLQPVADFLKACEQLEVKLAACLLDAAVKGEYGGTGQRAPWELIRGEYNFQDWPPLILAGGLKPENVSQAIEAVHPWGVDLASGVESAAGQKDQGLIQKLADAVSEE